MGTVKDLQSCYDKERFDGIKKKIEDYNWQYGE